MALSNKQQMFVEYYLATGNAAEAARQAGYSEKTARQQGSRLLTNVDVDAAIKARMKELKMSADEVLYRLADHARSSIGDHIELDFVGFPRVSFNPNKMHLVKSVQVIPGEFGTGIKFEMYDAQAALVQLGRNHKLFTDKTDHSTNDQPLTFNIMPAAAAPSSSPSNPGESADSGVDDDAG